MLRHTAESLRPGGRIIVVVGDKANLYPEIAELVGLEQEAIVQRHVNRRTGRRSNEFYESVLIWRNRRMEKRMAAEEQIKEAVSKVITAMMNRVMEKVLVTDPFLPDKHKADKPLYAALVPDEIFKGAHFERRFVTPFGAAWGIVSGSRSLSGAWPI